MEAKSWLIGCPNGHYSIHIVTLSKLYNLMVDGPNHLSRVAPSNNLIQYIDKEFAYSQGKLFARNLEEAVALGYSLDRTTFVHPDGRKVHFSNALDPDRSLEEFKHLLTIGES